jgi:hypothetical protein
MAPLVGFAFVYPALPPAGAGWMGGGGQIGVGLAVGSANADHHLVGTAKSLSQAMFLAVCP